MRHSAASGSRGVQWPHQICLRRHPNNDAAGPHDYPTGGGERECGQRSWPMSRRLLILISTMLAVGGGALFAQAPNPDSQANPTGNTGALKTQITTGGSYDAHSGNGTRIV